MLPNFFHLTKIMAQEIVSYFSESIRAETTRLIFKIFIGVILSSALITAFFHFGMAYTNWLQQFQNNYPYQLISFALVIILGVFALYKIFKPKNTVITEDKAKDLSSLAFTFGMGIIEGCLSQQEKYDSDTDKSEDVST